MYIVLLYYLCFVVVLAVKCIDRIILIKNDVHMWKYIRYTVYLYPSIYLYTFIYFIILCFSKIETTKTVFIFRFRFV